MKTPLRSRQIIGPFALLVVTAPMGCDFLLTTDAATRLAYDLEAASQRLRAQSASELVLDHKPESSPEGCKGDYTVTLQAGGAILVGCLGDHNYTSLGYSYSTTYHRRFVRVPRELRVAHSHGETTRIILRKVTGNDIAVVALQ